MTVSLTPIKETSTGMHGWLVMRGGLAGAEIGRMYDFGPGGTGMRWCGYAPDGTRFSARSQAKLIQKLQIHAAGATPVAV